VRIEGQTFADIQQAMAADVVIVTTEEIVEEQVLRQEPERNALPPFVVHYVCHVPFGSHPYAVYHYYDYDPIQLKAYHSSAGDDRLFQDYLHRYVLEPQNHAAYLEAIGGLERLETLKADPEFGYRADLKRRS